VAGIGLTVALAAAPEALGQYSRRFPIPPPPAAPPGPADPRHLTPQTYGRACTTQWGVRPPRVDRAGDAVPLLRAGGGGLGAGRRPGVDLVPAPADALIGWGALEGPPARTPGLGEAEASASFRAVPSVVTSAA
jgi:hypothetical protein